MTEQSGGPLFEFELEQRSNMEIWVKHRGTGHVYQFVISDDGLGLRTEHTVVSNPSSTIDAAMFSVPARRAAVAHLAKPVTGSAKPPIE
jgi:hypothetical protein